MEVQLQQALWQPQLQLANRWSEQQLQIRVACVKVCVQRRTAQAAVWQPMDSQLQSQLQACYSWAEPSGLGRERGRSERSEHGRVETGSREALPYTNVFFCLCLRAGRCAGRPPVLPLAMQYPPPSHTGGGGQQGPAV